MASPSDPPRTSTWRDNYKVHPAADVFPMMSSEELGALGADIKANGLNVPLSFCWVKTGTSAAHRVLIDGRNRLEAIERVGIRLRVRSSGLPESLHGKETATVIGGDPVALIIGLNIHRRHLTKQQQADLIIAAVTAGADPSPSWRGVTAYPVKTAAVEAAREHGISKRTVERALAKAEGKVPAKPKRRSKAEIAEARARGVDAIYELATMPTYTARPMPKPKSGKPVVGIDAVRQCYLDRCAEPDVDLELEQKIVFDALLEIAGKRALNGGKSPSRASTLPQDGRSEDGSL